MFTIESILCNSTNCVITFLIMHHTISKTCPEHMESRQRNGAREVTHLQKLKMDGYTLTDHPLSTMEIVVAKPVKCASADTALAAP